MPADTMIRPMRERATVSEWVADVRLGFLLSVGGISANFLTLVIFGLQQTLHFSPTMAGFVGSSNVAGIAVGSLVAALFAGSLARARWITIGFVAAGLIDLISPAITPFWPMAATRFIQGIAGGITSAALGLAIARHKSPARVVGASLVIQLTQAALALMILPPLIGRWGMTATYLPMAATALIGLALLPFEGKALKDIQVSPGSRSIAEQSSSSRNIYLLVALAATGLFVFQGSRFMTAGYSFAVGDYLHLDKAFVAGAFGLSTWLGVFGSLVAFVIGSRFGQTWPIIVTSVIIAAMNAAFITFGSQHWVFMLTSGVACIAVFVALPYFLTVCVAIDASGRLAVWSSFISCAGLAAGPVIGGFLLSRVGMLPLLIIASVLAALANIASIFPALAIDRKTARGREVTASISLDLANGTASA